MSEAHFLPVPVQMPLRVRMNRYQFAAALAALLAAAPAVAQQRALPPSFDVEGYDVQLVLPDTGARIEGEATIRVRGGAAGDTLVLALAPGMAVSAVAVDGAPAGWARRDGTVRVLLAGAAPARTVRVGYAGAPQDGLIIGRDSLGRWIAFGDNFPERARHWFPAVDEPGDKAAIAFTVLAPPGRTVVAPGRKVEEAPATHAGRALVRTRWTMERPLPTYSMVIAAAPLVRKELPDTACVGDEGRCIPQALYVAPEQASVPQPAFDRAGEMLRLFASLAGPYPYTELKHLQSTTRYGGMENATAIFYADRLFRTPGGVSEGLVAHEVAHQWFGDAVTERSWPHLWLSEGFATYLAELWTRHAHGDSAFREGMRELRREVLEAGVTAKRPVIDTIETQPSRLLNANSYQKGGFVLHMLRATVGDSAFVGALREYMHRHRHDGATTDDLRLLMERHSGQELGWFFDQWLRRAGNPVARVGWKLRADGQLLVQVRQRQAAAPYRFPLELEITDARGAAHRVTIPVPATRQASVVVPVQLAGPVRAVRLDPDVKLLATLEEADGGR